MKKMIIMSILIFSILISVSYVSASINISDCDTLLNTSNTTYTLNQSISIWGNNYCIGIEADNVTLDCDGYTITYGGDHADFKAISNEEGHDNITIKNCIINQNGSAPAQHAILFERSRNGVIFNNTITTFGGLPSIVNGTYGIYLGDNSTNANITFNTINTSGTYGIGIFLIDSSGSIIDNNVINTSGEYASGVYLFDSLNSNLTSNNITTSGGMADGIYTNLNSSFSLMYNNIISTSGSNYSDGIYLNEDTHNINITSNTITTSGYGGYGIAMYSKSNNLNSNTITTSATIGKGIYSGDNSSTIYGNIITTTGLWGDGIYINYASFNTVTNNIINTTNSFAIWVQGSVLQDYNHTIENNTEQGDIIYYLFNNNSGTIENQKVGGIGIANSYNVTLNNLTLDKDGIVFFYTNNSVIKNSNITISGTGIWGGIELDYSYYNNITDNTITTSGAGVDGIYLEGANHSTFTQNKIHVTGLNAFVIYSVSSDNNTFYNNLFNASTINLLSLSGFGYLENTPPSFTWNTTKTAGTNILGHSYLGGNFWTNNNSNGYSDTCIDSDGDYICDTPYSFDGIDYLPLANHTNMVSTCSILNVANKYYVLNQSITGVSGTCFNITANNITLDFASFNITGDNTGYGVNITGYNDTTIQDGVIYNFSYGIYLYSSSNNIFTNISIIGSKQDAIYLNGASSSNNNFTNITITNTNTSHYDIKFNTAGINGTWIIDSNFANYTFTGIGGKVNFKESSYGKIKFLEPINGSGTNLSSDINIRSNLIFVNSSNNAGLNKSANVTLYSITYTDPKPQYSSDGITYTDCTANTNPVCSELGFSGNNFIFNTTHFTYFRAAEAYSAPSGGGGGSSSLTYQCNDNKDNDGDGLIDYPDDPGCVSKYDISESDVKKEERKENWTCISWSECIEGKQTRTCVDYNKCNTTKNKPATEKSCVTESIPPSSLGISIGEVKENDGVNWKWGGNVWVKQGSPKYDQIGLEPEKEEAPLQAIIPLKKKTDNMTFIISGIVLIALLILFIIMKRKKYF